MKTTDSVDPIAVLTVLPLRRYASLTCLKEIRAYLTARCTTNTQQFLQVWHLDTAMPCTHMTYHHVSQKTHSVLCMIGKTSLTVSAFMHAPDVQAWDDPHSGLLLSERLVNCPPQLAPPLNQALFDELAWAKEDEPTQVPSLIWQCSGWCYAHTFKIIFLVSLCI